MELIILTIYKPYVVPAIIYVYLEKQKVNWLSPTAV